MSNLPPGAVPDDWGVYLPVFMGLLRTVLGVFGGAGFTWAVGVTDSQIQMVVSALMILAAAGWSAYQKISANRALRHAAAAPAGVAKPPLPL